MCGRAGTSTGWVFHPACFTDLSACDTGHMGKQDTLEMCNHGAGGHSQNSDLCMCLYVITHLRASEIFVVVDGIALNALAIRK